MNVKLIFAQNLRKKIKNNSSLGSKINQKQTKKIHLKEKKLNFVLIQNGKILVIFLCLQAKLQLFQEYKALFENFCCKNFAKAGKSLYSGRQSIRN